MTKDEAREILQKLSNGVLTFMEAEAIDCAIQALGDGWVSVDERLPEESTKVLAVFRSVFIGSVVVDVGLSNFTHGRFDSAIDRCKVTHWQPLPSPPKPKQP